MENNAQKFIDAIADVYGLKPDARRQLERNTRMFDRYFANYTWNDIKAAIDYFYTRKNDKTRPRLSQIQAILETWVVEKKITQIIPDPDIPRPVYKRPQTKIWAIAQPFDKLIDVLLDSGVLPQENGEFTNNRSLVDSETNELILCPQQWFSQKLSFAVSNFPHIFAPYPRATFWEQVAIALNNGLIKIKVRDWNKVAQAAKPSPVPEYPQFQRG